MARLLFEFQNSFTEQLSGLVSGQIAGQGAVSLGLTLAAGTGAGKYDLSYAEKDDASSSPMTIDLTAVEDEASGALEGFAKVKGLFLLNKGENDLIASGSFFGVSAGIVLAGGGALMLSEPAGLDITDAANNEITLSSADGTTFELRILGEKIAIPGA